MKRFIKEHKKWSAAGLVCLLCVGGAFAYYLSTGSGTAATEGGTVASSVSLSGIMNCPSSNSEIYPGDTCAVTVTATNKHNHVLNTSGASISSVTTGTPGCEPSWFSFSGETEPIEVPANSSVVLTKTLELLFKNEPFSQNACKGSTITANLSS